MQDSGSEVNYRFGLPNKVLNDGLETKYYKNVFHCITQVS